MKELRITNGVVIVDENDYEWLKKHAWSIDKKNGYAQLNIMAGLNSSMSMHRAIMKAKKGQFIDHINGNKLDNRKENLRFCTVQQNQFNRGVSNYSRTGYKGVYPTKNGKYGSAIRIDKKVKWLGTYGNPIDAAKAYDEFAKKHHGEFARLNFPSQQ